MKYINVPMVNAIFESAVSNQYRSPIRVRWNCLNMMHRKVGPANAPST